MALIQSEIDQLKIFKSVEQYFIGSDPKTHLYVDCTDAAIFNGVKFPSERLWLDTIKIELDFWTNISKLIKSDNQNLFELQLTHITGPLVITKSQIVDMRVNFFNNIHSHFLLSPKVVLNATAFDTRISCTFLRIQLVFSTILLAIHNNEKILVSKHRRFCICEETEKLMMCYRCKTRYCSIQCQKEDWPSHKNICKSCN